MEFSTLNIGGLGEFQLLELQGSTLMDDGAPLKILTDLINVFFFTMNF